MKILVVAATKNEMKPIENALFSVGFEMKESFLQKGEVEVELLITGIGLTATAFRLGQKLHSSTDYDIVLNIGVAGSFSSELKPPAVVHVSAEAFGDLGVEDNEKFIPIHEMALPSEPLFEGGFAINTTKHHYKTIADLKEAKAISVNIVHGEARTIARAKDIWNADIESMEGAAVFLCCLANSIPFIEVRAISNFVEPRNKDNWKLEEALNSLETFAVKWFKEVLNEEN